MRAPATTAHGSYSMYLLVVISGSVCLRYPTAAATNLPQSKSHEGPLLATLYPSRTGASFRPTYDASLSTNQCSLRLCVLASYIVMDGCT